MQSKQKMIDSYKYYGFNFPLKAQYIRQSNRFYFSDDFEDREEIEFFWNCDKPSACARGNAFYMNKKGTSKLVNIKELESMNYDNK